jgi:hypothetical protein
MPQTASAYPHQNLLTALSPLCYAVNTRKPLTMAEITKEQLNEALNTQLRAFRGVLQTEIIPIRETLDRHTATLNSHTITLDALGQKVDKWNTEGAAIKSAPDRHESWIQQIAKKFGFRLN